MAEGFLRAFGGTRFDAHSAGTVARGVHPLAVRAMAEVGVDISAQRSKTVDEMDGTPFDAVVTVCDSSCPIPPHTKLLLHWRFPDPSAAGGDEAHQLAAFRKVRDGLSGRVRSLVTRLGKEAFHAGASSSTG
jgi:arsenate reductase